MRLLPARIGQTFATVESSTEWIASRGGTEDRFVKNDRGVRALSGKRGEDAVSC